MVVCFYCGLVLRDLGELGDGYVYVVLVIDFVFV